MAARSRRNFLRLAAATATAASLGFVRTPSTFPAPSAHAHTDAQSPNIVMVTIDALRADHGSPYGYARATTPNLDEFMAAQGARFLAASTTSPWTYAANAAMLTGQSPTRLHATWTALGLPDATPTLPEILQGHGYQTAGFATAVLTRASYGFDHGFDYFDDELSYTHPNSAQAVAELVNARVLNWLDGERDPGKPLFLWVYYFDPHSWYNPPAPYATRFDDDYTGTLTPAAVADGQLIVSGDLVLSPRDHEHLLALYDGEIAYTDAMFGELMAALGTRGLLDDTLVTVTADHGESFGEHGQWIHAGSLYQEAMRVPLLLRYPGVIDAEVTVASPVSNMDLMPTILDYAGITPPTGLAAISLRSHLEPGAAVTRDVFCEVDGMNDPGHWIHWNASRHDLRAVYRGEWKYIHHVGHPHLDELYQLSAPLMRETDNRITTEPALARELLAAIKHEFGLWRTTLPLIER